MINNLNNNIADFESYSIESIDLEFQQIEKARKIALSLANKNKQWQAYLNSLALFAVENWLSEWAFDITFNTQECSLYNPQFLNLTESIFNLTIADFKINIIAIGTSSDQTASISKIIVDLPEYVAHFYLLVEVEEESQKANIIGFLQYNQLSNLLAYHNLKSEENWTYSVPIDWFNQSPEQLFLYLRCLSPLAIKLPSTVRKITSNIINIIKDQLTEALEKLKKEDTELWEVLTWQKMANILTNPELCQCFYNNLYSSSLTDIITKPIKPIINVGLWLENKLDELAEQLSWVLLPPLEMFSPEIVGLRSPTVNELTDLLQQIEQQGKRIPAIARAAYKDFRLGELALRLYVVTWSMISQDNIPEWKLLLILGGQPGENYPQGINLKVSDETGIIVNKTLDILSQESHIYSQVAGTLDEEFLVTITSYNGDSLTLPPFRFK